MTYCTECPNSTQPPNFPIYYYADIEFVLDHVNIELNVFRTFLQMYYADNSTIFLLDERYIDYLSYLDAEITYEFKYVFYYDSIYQVQLDLIGKYTQLLQIPQIRVMYQLPSIFSSSYSFKWDDIEQYKKINSVFPTYDDSTYPTIAQKSNEILKRIRKRVTTWLYREFIISWSSGKWVGSLFESALLREILGYL